MAETVNTPGSATAALRVSGPVHHDFDGGVVLAGGLARRPTRGTPLLAATVPPSLELPLYHGRAPLTPAATPGQHVYKGELLATGAVALHAPTSGRIIAIEPRPMMHPSGAAVPALLLEADGDDAWHPQITPGSAPPASMAALIACIRGAGIAGMGGAGYPLLEKLGHALASQPKRLRLLVNAVECEPGITSDEALLVDHGDEVVAGIELLCGAIGIGRCVIALDPSNTAAGAALAAAVAARRAPAADIELVLAPPRFPAGSERQLVQAVDGRRLPPGQRPLALGWLCQSPATLHALYRAVALGQPLIERIVTLTGPALARPCHRWVRIGHPIAALLDEAGAEWPDGRSAEILHGGPVTGWPVPAAAAVSKQTYGLYGRTPVQRPVHPCINCNRCAEVCPERLQPQALLRLVESAASNARRIDGLDACIECGACELVCPSALPLLATFRWARAERDLERGVRQRAADARQRFERHEARRLARAAAERDRRAQRLARDQTLRRRWVDP